MLRFVQSVRGTKLAQHANMGEIGVLSHGYCIEPQNGWAQQGMERLEKMMGGIDPDNEDEMWDGDEMHDDDDVGPEWSDHLITV